MKLSDKEKKEMIAEAGELIAFGRGMVKKKVPYIANTLYGLIWRPVFEPGMTMGVTPGLVCYFNPAWIVNEPAFKDKDGREKMVGCVFHEPWHVIHGFDRLKTLMNRGIQEHKLDPKTAMYIANLADDISINAMGRKAGFQFPPWVVFPETFSIPEKLIMEENWQLLMQQKQEIQQTLRAHGVGQGGEQDDGQGDGQGDGKWKPGPCAGACGGAAGTGNDKSKEVEKKLDSQYGRHKADIERIRRTTINDIKDHAERHGRGSTTGYNQTLVDFKRTRPLVRWETKFNHVLRMTSGNIVPGDDDYSMLRPDKHSALLGICMPSLISTEPEFCFVRDSSASMGTKELNYANNEIINAMKAVGASIAWLIDADTEVKGRPKRVSINDIPRIPVKGRGGTSFVQVFEEIKKLNPRPDIVIYLTDGDGWAPNKKPRGFEVVWCIVPSRWRKTKPADWGHIIVCSNDPDVREGWAAAS